MAPIKFEEDIQKTLEQRRIQPSINAWNSLENSLDKDANKRKNKGFWWIGVAASIVGIIWITVSFFNSNVQNIEPIIVDVPVIETQINSVKQKIIETKIEKTSPNKTSSNIATVKNKPQEPVEKKKEISFEKVEKQEILIAKTEVSKTNVLTDEEIQIQKLVNQIVTLEKDNNTATDQEIELLMLKAQQKLAEKKFKKSGMSVSAYALLLDVEEELDPSFKEKVFNILSENYLSVKNAVAQRND